MPRKKKTDNPVQISDSPERALEFLRCASRFVDGVWTFTGDDFDTMFIELFNGMDEDVFWENFTASGSPIREKVHPRKLLAIVSGLLNMVSAHEVYSALKHARGEYWNEEYDDGEQTERQLLIELLTNEAPITPGHCFKKGKS